MCIFNTRGNAENVCTQSTRTPKQNHRLRVPAECSYNNACSAHLTTTSSRTDTWNCIRQAAARSAAHRQRAYTISSRHCAEVRAPLIWQSRASMKLVLTVTCIYNVPEMCVQHQIRPLHAAHARNSMCADSGTNSATPPTRRECQQQPCRKMQCTVHISAT